MNLTVEISLDILANLLYFIKIVVAGLMDMPDRKEHGMRKADIANELYEKVGISKKEAAEIIEKVLDAEHKHAQSDRKDHEAVECLHKGPLRPTQSLGDLN